jgi:hypothetical protein
MTPRSVEARYEDPLDVIWLGCARTLGLTVERSDEVYASFDGRSKLTLSTREHFDADDSLAQLIFHELCHGLVASVGGPERMRRSDWGMENVDERDLLAEHACHRVQAALADRYGLRGLFAVTTDHRVYWDALPLDPLAPGDDPAIWLARDAFQRALHGPWASALAKALSDTARIAEIARASCSDPHSLWRRTQALHASGFPIDARSDKTCGDCGFSFRDGKSLRCRKTRALPSERGKRVPESATACVRFEPVLDEAECRRCGACCREAFDRVDVGARELVRKAHPELVAVDGYGPHLPRPHGRCVALTASSEGHTCRIYAERPRSCADFAIAGDACLTARRRVGLSA